MNKEPHKLFNFVIGLSGPYGSGCSSLAEEVVKIINDWPGCYCKRIQISDIIKYWHKKLIDNVTVSLPTSDPDRRKFLQKAGNDIRKKKHDLIGQLVAHEIRADAIEKENSENIEKTGTFVYVVDSLKNISDLVSLRSIFKDEFFFCFVTANNEIRWRRMRDYKSWNEEGKAEFQQIDSIDSDQKQIDPSVENSGQQVKKLAAHADYYIVNNDTREDLHTTAYRMACLIFGLNINQPTKDEKSMHIAFSSANQSACLSRQVGAAIFTKEGNILAIGHNDVPKAKGGLYTIEDENLDHRCLNVGDRRCINDTNKEERFKNLTDKINADLLDYFKSNLNKEALDLVEPLFSEGSSHPIHETIFSIVKNSQFKDATEYCRAVHAEMDALLSVCRNLSGSTIGASVYVTTQPCHNCVKHLIAAGVDRVVYIEPYPKSLGEELHSDAISLNPQQSDPSQRKISFLPYQGLAPRRYHDIFDMHEKRKDNDGKMCYRSKLDVAFSPKFSQRIDKRTRIKDGETHKDLITVYEIQASDSIGILLEEFNKGGEA